MTAFMPDSTSHGRKSDRVKNIGERGNMAIVPEPLSASPTKSENFAAWSVSSHPIWARQEFPRPAQCNVETRNSYSTDFPTHIGMKKLPPIRPHESKSECKPHEGVGETSERYRNFLPSDVKQTRYASIPAVDASSRIVTDVKQSNKANRSKGIRYLNEIQSTATNKGDNLSPREIHNIQMRRATMSVDDFSKEREPFHAITTTRRSDFRLSPSIELINKSNIASSPRSLKEEGTHRKSNERNQIFRPIGQPTATSESFDEQTCQSESGTLTNNQ